MQLSLAEHQAIVTWSTGCALRALGCFEERHSTDGRPRHALESAACWTRGELDTKMVQEAALNAFAAARSSDRGAASLAALAAGHAAASTSRKLSHATHAAAYARAALYLHKAATLGSDALRESYRAEEVRQLSELPLRLRRFVYPLAMLN